MLDNLNLVFPIPQTVKPDSSLTWLENGRHNRTQPMKSAFRQVIGTRT